MVYFIAERAQTTRWSTSMGNPRLSSVYTNVSTNVFTAPSGVECSDSFTDTQTPLAGLIKRERLILSAGESAAGESAAKLPGDSTGDGVFNAPISCIV